MEKTSVRQSHTQLFLHKVLGKKREAKNHVLFKTCHVSRLPHKNDAGIPVSNVLWHNYGKIHYLKLLQEIVSYPSKKRVGK